MLPDFKTELTAALAAAFVPTLTRFGTGGPTSEICRIWVD